MGTSESNNVRGRLSAELSKLTGKPAYRGSQLILFKESLAKVKSGCVFWAQ